MSRFNKHKSNKPVALQTAIIAKSVHGDCNSKIAKDLGIDRGTVQRILSSSEIQQHVLEGRSRAISLIPKALDAVEHCLDKNDGGVATRVLSGTQVFITQQISHQTTNSSAVIIAQLKQAKTEVESEPINTSIVTTDNV